MRKVIVIGSQHHNTLSIVRCFGHKGVLVDVILYGCAESYIAKSQYIDTVFFVDSIDLLIHLLKQQYKSANKPLLISCADQVSHLLDLNYHEIKDDFLFSTCGEGQLLTKFMDKKLQSQIAFECGFNIPQIYNDSNITFPCIIKPEESIYGGKNIKICYNRNDYDSVLKSFYLKDRYIAQQYLKKDEEIVITGLSLDNEIIIPAYIHKIRERNGGTTFSRVLPISELPKQLVDSTKKIVNKMSYHGLFGLECIRVEDTYYFIELNLRNDATTYSIEQAGINLPYILYSKNFGITSDEKNNSITPIKSLVETRDFDFVLNGQLGLLNWLKCLSSVECRYIYDKSDPKPYCGVPQTLLKNYIISRLSMIKHKLFKANGQ